MEVSSEKIIRIPIALCEIFLVFFLVKKWQKRAMEDGPQSKTECVSPGLTFSFTTKKHSSDRF